MAGKRRRGWGGEKEVAQDSQQVTYEKERAAMLEQNKQRMLELGLANLSKQISKPRANSSTKAKPKQNYTIPPSGPIRRSSRLQGTPSVSYKEGGIDEERGKGSREPKWKQGTKPEIYTEEDEKLLGSCEEPWELFVDGCNEEGSRVYDRSIGKTCHQCRQKTLGHRTSCSSCKALQGEFCGDCIYMRYGENVLETQRNPKWTCPVCRGICNCSICRPKRGWCATGALYRKISALGYKSVAHYLILTRRAVPVD